MKAYSPQIKKVYVHNEIAICKEECSGVTLGSCPHCMGSILQDELVA